MCMPCTEIGVVVGVIRSVWGGGSGGGCLSRAGSAVCVSRSRSAVWLGRIWRYAGVLLCPASMLLEVKACMHSVVDGRFAWWVGVSAVFGGEVGEVLVWGSWVVQFVAGGPSAIWCNHIWRWRRVLCCSERMPLEVK